MANSYDTYTGDGTTTTFNVTFPYIFQSEVSCTVNGQTVSFNWPTSSSITLALAPPSGAAVIITRTTNVTNPDVVFADGSTVRASDLNLSLQQVLYGLQDAQDQYNAALQSALGSHGVLPGVNTGNNGSLLVVAAGVWAVKTTAQAGFGSAAFFPTGTTGSTIPLNSSLGTAAYVNTGTSAGQVPLSNQLGSAAFSANTSFRRLLNVNPAASATLSNVTTAQTFNVNYAMPANTLSALGKSVCIRAGGIIFCGASQSISVTLTIGPQSFQSITFSAPSGNSGFWIDAYVTLHSAPGASATVGIVGDFAIGQTGGAADNPAIGNDYSFNTTSINTISVSVASSTANNSCILNTLIVEALN